MGHKIWAVKLTHFNFFPQSISVFNCFSFKLEMRIKEPYTKITLATFFVILGLAMMAAIQDENSLGFCLFDFVE